MPYIKDENNRRHQMDLIVSLMVDLDVEVNGDLNYILYKFCQKVVKPESYNSYKNFIGELDCCAREIYRRLVASHEDKAIEKNGDVI